MKRTPSRVAMVAIAGVALVVVAVVGVAALGSEPEDRFCTTGLAFREVDGVSYELEDQGSAGRDGCDKGDGVWGDPYLPVEGFGLGYLGYDCRIHVAEDEVTDETVIPPNRPDGSCGKVEP
jgi:hypothetical protein